MPRTVAAPITRDPSTAFKWRPDIGARPETTARPAVIVDGRGSPPLGPVTAETAS
jgi:hypothetical protein